MSKGNRSNGNRPLENLDDHLAGMQISAPCEGFADRVMIRLSEGAGSRTAAESRIAGEARSGAVAHRAADGAAQARRRFSQEWKNGLVAAAATLVFVASDIPAQIASMDTMRVGTLIQVKVLAAVDYGIQIIQMM